MNPAAPEPDSVEAAPAAAPAGGVRFCARCGGALGVEAACSACSVQVESAAAPSALRIPLVMYFLLLAVSMAMLGWMLTRPEANAAELGRAELIAVGLHTAIVLLFAALNPGLVKRELACLPRAGWFWMMVPLAGALLVLASGYMALLSRLGMQEVRYTDSMREAGLSWATIFILVSLQPAIIEELAFRGVIFSALRRALGPWETVFVGGFMFAALHVMPLALPIHVTAGIILGWVRLKSGSLYPCMLLHGLYNGGVIVLEIVEVT